jgi:hypothetical protein
MIKTIFIVVMFFSFIVIVVGTNNAYTHSDKFREGEQESTLAAAIVNMTDEMKYLCLEMDAKDGIDQIEDKEQQKQCEEFLDKVSIYEIRELIDKYLGVKDN